MNHQSPTHRPAPFLDPHFTQHGMKNIASCLNWVLIVGPFLFYGWVAYSKLIPVEYPDAFAYLWRQPFNWSYLTGRSLTQRLLFSLVLNEPQMIVLLQLLIYLLSAVIIYLLFAQKNSILYNLLLSVAVMFLFSSYTLNVSAVIINAEPIFVALTILFPFVLFLFKGRYQIFLVLTLGILFIFSKNVAPYTTILLVIWRFITMRGRIERQTLVGYLGLVIVSLASITLTHAYDTSLQINTVNNMYRRVFPDPAITTYFQTHYGMPVGSFVTQCQGAWIGEPCFGHSLITINPRSRNYELVADSFGFVTWVQQDGQQAYLRFLLWDSSMDTYREFRRVVREVMQSDAVIFINSYLGANLPNNTPNNLKALALLHPSGAIGFLGVDPFLLIRNMLLIFKFEYVEVLWLYIAIGLGVTRRCKYVSYLPLATSMLVVGLALFFLSFFGDSMEVIRHIFPALIILELGGFLYVVSFVAIGVYYVRQQWQVVG